MEFRVSVLSIFTFIIFKVAFVSSGATDSDNSISEVPTGDDRYDLFLPGDLDSIDKRPSLFRYGKRGSLFRFGKRGSIMRFGKRGSIMRFGKRGDEEEENLYADADVYPEIPFSDYLADKRSTILRFGKRPSILRFGRGSNTDNNNRRPHTPWRFGRMGEDEEDVATV